MKQEDVFTGQRVWVWFYWKYVSGTITEIHMGGVLCVVKLKNGQTVTACPEMLFTKREDVLEEINQRIITLMRQREELPQKPEDDA